ACPAINCPGTTYIIYSKDKTIRYYFVQEEKTSTVALQGWEDLTQPITSFGLRKGFYSQEWMATPLYEYSDQLPEEFLELSERSIGSNGKTYFSSGKFLSGLPTHIAAIQAIERYKEQIALAELRQSNLTNPPLSLPTKLEAEIVKPDQKLLEQTPIERRYLVNDQWTRALALMDSIDNKIKKETSGYPHLQIIESMVYHRKQGLPFPDPNTDGRRQLVEAISWIHRLGQAISPVKLLELPLVNDAQSNQITDDFLKNNDPTWSKTTLDIAELLEPIVLGADLQLYYSLTDENYEKLDTDQKKLIAFILLRDRVSDMAAGIVNTFTARLDINTMPDFYDFDTLYNAAVAGNSIDAARKKLLAEPMGAEKTVLDWIRQVMDDPLLTNTKEVYFYGKNHIREQFVEQVATADKKIDEQIKDAPARGRLKEIRDQRPALFQDPNIKIAILYEIKQGFSQLRAIVILDQDNKIKAIYSGLDPGGFVLRQDEALSLRDFDILKRNATPRDIVNAIANAGVKVTTPIEQPKVAAALPPQQGPTLLQPVSADKPLPFAVLQTQTPASFDSNVINNAQTARILTQAVAKNTNLDDKKQLTARQMALNVLITQLKDYYAKLQEIYNKQCQSVKNNNIFSPVSLAFAQGTGNCLTSQQIAKGIDELIAKYGDKDSFQALLNQEAVTNGFALNELNTLTLAQTASEIFLTQAQLAKDQTIVLLAWNRAKQTTSYAKIPLLGDMLLYLREFNKPLAKIVAEELAPSPTVRVFAHRAGFLETVISLGEVKTQNSIPRAKDSLTIVDGVELDLRFTSDGIAVITHDDVRKMSFEEFKEKNPSHDTLETWVEWFKQKGMEEKEIYLDLKGTEQDPYKLLQLVSDLGNRVSIGSRDKKTVFKLLLARKILGLKTKIYLQIPDPIFNPFNPSGVLSDAENLGKTVGLEAKVNHADTEEQEIYNLKADGVHFFWPENLWSAIWSEIQNNGRRVPVTDQSKIPGKIAVFPNIPLFANLQKARLETFVKTAKRLGYEVIGGSTASPAIMQMMIDWGVNTIMPNDPTLLPGFLKRDDSPQNIPDPKGRFLNTRTDLKEGNIVSEKTESDPLRTKYLKFASRLGSQQPVVFQKPAGLSGTNTNSPQPETLVFTEVSVNTDRQLPVPDNATLKVNDTIIEVRNVTILQVVASNEVNQVLPISAPNQPLSNYYFLEKDQTYQFIDNTSGEVLAEAAIGQTPILIASAFYQGNVFDQTISFARLFLYLTNLYLLNPIRHLYQPLQKSIVTAAQHFLQNHSKTNDFIVKAIMKIRDLLAGTIRLTRNIIRNVLPAWSDGLGRILITLDQGRTLPAIKNTAPPKHLPEREPSINAQKPADLISLPLFSTAGLNETDIENLNKVLPQIRTIAQDLYDKTLKALTKHNVLLEYDTKLTRLNVSQTLDTLSWAVVADKNQVKKFNPYLRLLISNLINTPGSGLQDKISPEALAEIAENAILNTLEQISQLAKQNNNVVTLKPLDLSPLANISALNTNAVLKENNGKNEFDLTKFDPIDKNKPFGLINPLTGKNVGRVLFVSKPSYRPGLIIFEDNSLRLFIAKPAQRYGYVQLTSDNSPGSEITMANIFSDLLTQNLWHNSGLVIPPSQIALLGLKSSADQGPSINENYIITPFLDNTLVLSDVENIQTQITSENKNARTALLALSLAFGNWDLKPADIFADRQNKNQIKALDFENTILNFLENGGAGGIPKDDPGIGEKVDIVNQNPIFHLLYLIENDPEYKYIFAEFKNIFADLTIADLKPFLDSLKTYLSNPYHLQALLEKNGYAKEQATRSIARLTHYVKNLEQNTGVLLDYLTGKIGFIDAASALVETTKPLLVNLFNDAIGYPKLSTDETIGPTKPISLALLQKFAARSAIDKNLTLVADEQEIVNEIAAAVKNTTSLSRLEQEIAARTAVKILAENFLEFLTQVDPTDKKYQEVQNLNEEIKRLIPIFSKKEAIQGRLAGELRKNYSLKPDDAYLAAISEVMSGIFTKQAELIRQQAIVVLAWNRAKQTNRLARLPIIGNLLLYLQSFNKPLAQLVSEQLAFSQKPADLPERPAGPNPGATLQRVFPVDTSALPALQVIHLETQNRLKLLARLLNADSKLRFLDPKTRGKGMNQDPFLKFIAKEDYNFLALFDGDRVLGFALYQTYTNGRISIRRVFLNPNENQSQAAIVFKLIHFFQNNNLIKKIYLSDEPIRSPSLNAIYSELGFADNLWQREPIVPSPTTSISLTPFWRFADSVSIFVNNAFGIVSGSTPVASNKGDHFEVTFSEHNRIVAKSLKGQGDKKTTLTIQEGDLIYPQDFPFEYQKAVSPGKFFYLNPNKVFILERNGQKYEILLNEPIPTVNKFVELGTRAILGITTLTAGILGTYWYARFQIDITLPNFFNALPPGWRSKIVLGILTFYLNLINILPYTAQIQYSLQLDNYRNYLETKVNPELSKYGYKMVLEPQGESQAGQPGSTPLLVTKVVPLATNPPSSTVNDKLFNEGLPSAKSGSTQPQIPANTKEPVIVQNVQSPPPKPKSEAPAIPLGNQQAIVSRQNNQQNVVSQPKQIINSQNIALKTVTGGNLFSYKNSTHFSYTSIRWSDPERSYGDYVGSWEQLAGNPEFGWFDRDGIFHNYKREEVKGQDGKNYSGYVVAERSGKPGYIESISLPYDKSDVAISDLEALLDSSKRELKEWGNAGDLKNIMIVIDGKVVFNDTVKKLIQGNNSAPYLKLFGRRYDQMGALVSTYPWVYKDNFKIIVYGDTQPRYFDVQGVEFENDDSNSIVPSTGSTNDFPSNLESQYETQTISPEKVVDKNGFAKSENLSVGVNKPAVLSFSGQRTLNSIQISLPKQFADSYPDSLMMEISNDGKVVFEMPVSEFFGEPGRLSLYHSSPIGIMPDPANPNNYLLYSNIPMVFNNLKITFKVSDKTPNVNFNFKYDLQPVTHDGTLEVITKKIHVRAGEPDMSIDITDDGLIVGMVIAGHNNTINPNDPKQIDPNSKPSPQKPWGTNFIEGNVIVRSNTQVGQNSKIVYAADGWEALPGCGFGCGPQGLSKPAGYSNTPAYLPTAGLLSADAYNPHPSATFFNYGLNISFQNGGRINIGHGNYKNNSELDIWVKVFIIRPPKPKSEAPIIQSITELKNVSQSQTNATPITDLLKLVPDSFMGEMIKPFVADTLRQREERRKNDPNWTKRVDQSLNAERINFLLFGSGWNYEPPDFTKPGITHGSYTIVSYNLKTGKVDLISISNDFGSPEVALAKKLGPDVLNPTTRISEAYATGGFDLMRQAVEDATGFSIDFQLVFEDDMIAKFIDNVFGKIEVDVPFDVKTYPYYFNQQLQVGLEFKKGRQSMDGKTVLGYIKANAQGDYDKRTERSARKQAFTKAVKEEMAKKIVLEQTGFVSKLSKFLVEVLNKKGANYDFEQKLITIDNLKILTSLLGHLTNVGFPQIDNTITLADEYSGDGGGVRNVSGDMYLPRNANPKGDLVNDYWRELRNFVKSKLISPVSQLPSQNSTSQKTSAFAGGGTVSSPLEGLINAFLTIMKTLNHIFGNQVLNLVNNLVYSGALPEGNLLQRTITFEKIIDEVTNKEGKERDYYINFAILPWVLANGGEIYYKIEKNYTLAAALMRHYLYGNGKDFDITDLYKQTIVKLYRRDGLQFDIFNDQFNIQLTNEKDDNQVFLDYLRQSFHPDLGGNSQKGMVRVFSKSPLPPTDKNNASFHIQIRRLAGPGDFGENKKDSYYELGNSLNAYGMDIEGDVTSVTINTKDPRLVDLVFQNAKYSIIDFYDWDPNVMSVGGGYFGLLSRELIRVLANHGIDLNHYPWLKPLVEKFFDKITEKTPILLTNAQASSLGEYFLADPFKIRAEYTLPTGFTISMDKTTFEAPINKNIKPKEDLDYGYYRDVILITWPDGGNGSVSSPKELEEWLSDSPGETFKVTNYFKNEIVVFGVKIPPGKTVEITIPSQPQNLAPSQNPAPAAKSVSGLQRPIIPGEKTTGATGIAATIIGSPLKGMDLVSQTLLNIAQKTGFTPGQPITNPFEQFKKAIFDILVWESETVGGWARGWMDFLVEQKQLPEGNPLQRILVFHKIETEVVKRNGVDRENYIKDVAWPWLKINALDY
ncbi:LCP family protein, partial [Candidatus Gottesmanbacteria bacterium]|nr:LCP family protein [Candidatus Gottesmanbacteria bacterium]